MKRIILGHAVAYGVVAAVALWLAAALLPLAVDVPDLPDLRPSGPDLVLGSH